MRLIRSALLGATVLSTCGLGHATAAAESSAPAAAQTVGEVVVTAERHNSTVLKTPISMSAESGKELAAKGIVTIEGVVADVPGLSLRSAGPGQTEYEARGVASNGGSSATVGFYLNDVPLSAPTSGQTGKVVIDPNLYDIDHVEVLRGPQGTLYGSSSEAGTIRIATNPPVLNAYQASIETVGSDTAGGGANGAINGMVNAPVGDKLAIRIVAGDLYRSGWIDRYVLDPFPLVAQTSPLGSNGRGDVVDAPVADTVKNVNTEKLWNGRVSVLYKPFDSLSITAMAFHQEMVMRGYDQFQSPPGKDHEGIYQAFNIPEPVIDKISVYSLTAVQNLGFADLTSATSYWSRESEFTQDASENVYYDFGLSQIVPLPYTEIDRTRQFSEEIRLSSAESSTRFRWTIGGFYSDFHAIWIQHGADPLNGVIAAQSLPQVNPDGIIFDSYNPYRLRQYALFADGSFAITDKLKFAAGLRWVRYQSIELNNEWGDGLPTVTRPTEPFVTKNAASAITPRFNLSYQPTDDLNFYAAVAEGFRPGGANQYVPSFCNAGNGVNSFNPDSLWNYEVGEKARLFGGRVTVNSDFFYITWYNIQQLGLLSCGYEYYENAGNGRSYGPELEMTAKITNNLTFGLNGAYTNAEITHPVANLAENVINNAQPGSITTCPSVSQCTLPILNVPKYTVNYSLSYSRPLFGNFVLNGRLSDSLVGPSVDESFYPIVHLPTYNMVNFRLGVATPKWSADVFIDNLTNVKTEMTANNTSFQWNNGAYVRYSTSQPLTAGIDLKYKFN
jgi:outer membrane receptor protein involved in Fe transport